MPEMVQSWDVLAKRLLKSELKRCGVTYTRLVEQLAKIGISESEPNVRNKIARGKLTAVFLLQVLTAIGVKEIRLD